MNRKDVRRKAEIRASIKERLPEIDESVFEELVEITYEHHSVFKNSAFNFFVYTLYGILLTAPLVWLCSLVVKSEKLLIVCSIVICSSIIIALIIMACCNIYSRVARSELYLNTLHQTITESKNSKKGGESGLV